MIFLAFIFILTFTTQSYCAEVDISDYSDLGLLAPCDAKAPDFDGCIREYLQIFWNTFANANGSEKLHLPPLDPFTLNERRWTFRNELFDFIFHTNKLKIINMRETTIHKARVKFLDNSKKYSLELDMSDPEVILDSDFKLNLKISDLKIRQKGHFNLKIIKIHNYAKATGIIEKRGNFHYLRIKAVNFKPDIKDFRFLITRNDSNDPSASLDETVMSFFNNNLKDIYKSFLVEAKPLWEPIILEIADECFKNIPLELMFTNWQ